MRQSCRRTCTWYYHADSERPGIPGLPPFTAMFAQVCATCHGLTGAGYSSPADARDNQGQGLIDVQRHSKAALRKKYLRTSGLKPIINSLSAAALNSDCRAVLIQIVAPHAVRWAQRTLSSVFAETYSV